MLNCHRLYLWSFYPYLRGIELICNNGYVLQQTVLFGGVGAGLAEGLDTWIWDGKTWVKQATSGPPGMINYPSAAYDENKQVVVLLLSEGDKQHEVSQTWFWDGVDWVSTVK